MTFVKRENTVQLLSALKPSADGLQFRASTVDHWKPNEICSNKHAIHPSIFLCRISKISHYAYCYTIGLRQLSCLGLMSGCLRLT